MSKRTRESFAPAAPILDGDPDNHGAPDGRMPTAVELIDATEEQARAMRARMVADAALRWRDARRREAAVDRRLELMVAYCPLNPRDGLSEYERASARFGGPASKAESDARYKLGEAVIAAANWDLDASYDEDWYEDLHHGGQKVFTERVVLAALVALAEALVG